MIKLRELIGKKFTSKQTSSDPETGVTSWSVNYTPDFTGVVKSYNRLISDLNKALVANNLQEDETLIDVLKSLKANRTFFHKTVKRKYPEYIEKLSKR